MNQPSNPFQEIFAGIELLEIRLVVRLSNAYDSFLVWKCQDEILQALQLGEMVSRKQPYLDVVLGDKLIDTTERFNS